MVKKETFINILELYRKFDKKTDDFNKKLEDFISNIKTREFSSEKRSTNYLDSFNTIDT